MKDVFDRLKRPDRLPLTTDRTFFIHDFDNVHWPYNALPNVYDFYAEMKVLVVKPVLPHLSDDEIKTIGTRSYHETGDGLLLFSDYARQLGMDYEEARSLLHSEFHRVAYEHLKQRAPSIFTPCEKTNAAMAQTMPFIHHVVLSQAHKEYWIEPMATSQNKLPFFKSVIDFAGMGFTTKLMSPEPVARTMKHMTARPEQTVFIEDSLHNLEQAKKLDRRILTVYVYHDIPLSLLPAYVDMQVSSVDRLLTQAAQLHLAPNRQQERNL